MTSSARPADDLTVVIVAWNCVDDLDGLVPSLMTALEGIDHTIVVVDNDSSDDTVAEFRRRLPEAIVVDTGVNAGYAAAINRGMAEHPSTGPVLVVNPDAWPEPDAVSRLLGRLDRPGVGVVVPRFVDADGALLLQIRQVPTLPRALAEGLLGGSLSGRFRLGEYVTEPSVYEQAHRIGWGTGAMVAISRACLDDVGAWDERFFLYSEETDFMLRADAAGHEIWFEPAACVVHPGGESQTAPRLYALLVRNMVTATTKWRGRWAGAAMWVVRVLAELVRYPADRDRHGRALRALVRPQPWAVVQAGGVVRPPTG